jgi:segregation and condensation protein A
VTEFTIRVGEFDGPLDLLLSLIQDRKLFINEISLAEVTDAYLSHIQKLTLPLGEVSQFVLVAATLLLVKSRSLLPNLELTDEEEGDVIELEKRLRRYQIIKQGARLLMNAWGEAPLREPARPPVRLAPRFAPGETNLTILTEALQKLITTLPVASVRDSANVAPTISLESMIEQLEKRVLKAVKMRFGELTANASKSEIVIQFLALLELARGKSITVKQDRAFSDIMLESDRVDTPHYGA